MVLGTISSVDLFPGVNVEVEEATDDVSEALSPACVGLASLLPKSIALPLDGSIMVIAELTRFFGCSCGCCCGTKV